MGTSTTTSSKSKKSQTVGKDLIKKAEKKAGLDEDDTKLSAGSDESEDLEDDDEIEESDTKSSTIKSKNKFAKNQKQ